MTNREGKQHKVSSLALLSGAIGFAITASLIGFIGWEAIHPAQENVPWIELRTAEVHRSHGGFVVAFEARNTTSQSAAGVEIEGTLATGGSKPLVSSVTLDYIPGGSVRKGGLYFPADPRSGRLELRALGFEKP